MFALRPLMANHAKPSSLEKKKTNLVKIDPELVEKIAWIVRIRNDSGEDAEWTAARIIEPLIRTSVERDYNLIKDQVESIKRDQAKAAKRLKDRDEAAKQP